MSTIKPEIVDKAVEAGMNQERVRLGRNPISLDGLSSEYAERLRDEYRAALEAVADDLRAEGAAQSLRGAAETLDGAMPRHLGVSDLDYLDYDTDVEYGIDRAAEFLRARADEIEARDE